MDPNKFPSNLSQKLDYSFQRFFVLLFRVSGLILRKIFIFFTHQRKTREKYHGGMKQLAEHMNSVTRTMSHDPNQAFAQDSPLPKARLVHQFSTGTLSQNDDVIAANSSVPQQPGGIQMGNIAETSLVFVPTRRESRIAELTAARQQLEARRLSRFKNFFENED